MEKEVVEKIEEEGKALKNAFTIFSKEALRLEKSYKELGRRFNAIEKKLRHSYEILQQKNRALETTTKNLETILSHMAQGILFIDEKKNVQAYNRAAEDIFGSLIEDFQKIEILLNIPLETIFSKGKDEHYFCSFSLQSLNKQLEVSTSCVKNEENKVEAVILLIKDITEIRRLETIALRNDRLKELGEMAAGLAHEIRNPLSGIQGFAALLYRDLEHAPKLQNMVQAIMEGVSTLNNFVSSVLDFTKPLEVHLELLPLAVPIKRVIDLVSVQKKANIEIKLSLEDECLAWFDPHLIYFAFLNLALNAMDAMDAKGGCLNIQVKKEANDAIAIFSDEGIGIAKESLEKLFTPFFTTKTKGHGLGLAEVHKIIEAHHGKIEVYSQQDKGSQFIVTLPAK